MGEATMIRMGVVVLSWTGPRTTEVVIRQLLGTILKTAQILPGTAVVVACLAVQCTPVHLTRRMARVSTFRSAAITTAAAARRMQQELTEQSFTRLSGRVGSQVIAVRETWALLALWSGI